MALSREKMYYRIGEVASMLGVEASTLRFWEKEFKLRPKRSGNERLYTSEDIEKLRRIKYLVKEEKYTLEGARRKLRQMRYAPADKDELIELLEKFKQELLRLRKELKDNL